MTDKVQHHKDICEALNVMFKLKNKDYGDSFHELYSKYGLLSSVIRLNDKLNRIEKLCSSEKPSVPEESIRDTLLDLANYAIMTVMELDNYEGKRISGETD